MRVVRLAVLGAAIAMVGLVCLAIPSKAGSWYFATSEFVGLRLDPDSQMLQPASVRMVGVGLCFLGGWAWWRAYKIGAVG